MGFRIPDKIDDCGDGAKIITRAPAPDRRPARDRCHAPTRQANQQTADGARGAGAARNTNCQTRFQPGGAPVASVTAVATNDKSRRAACRTGAAITALDAAGTDCGAIFEK